ncbi:Acetoin dehydrogenase E1 component beta-subunit [Enhygromyxa salina]|uniref:3-methyl-2-oxobutanoate dehydrogenase (2-methylpropanoyl-transferring) n=1 Tax=Enhygromyxa salina TaxID=215803 RepID=A0A0C2D0S1_9BACT|nr:Acetoin dehydrogenase E1 component beta-subunit [Enhygromyxa salina]
MAKLVAALLREDDRRCLLGEDVRSGGMLGLSRVAAEDDQLRARLLGSPLTGAGLIAHTGGLALAGLRPIVLLPSAAALLEGLPALRELGRLGWRSGDQHGVPALFVAPDGPGFGIGGDAAESAEPTLTAIPGVQVWCAGRSEDLCGYLRSAAEFPSADQPSGPRVLLLPRSVIVRDLMTNVDLDAGLSRAPTAVLREGDRATVFAWGSALAPALAAADACAKQSGIQVNVVELGCLAPLDEGLLVKLANATGKLVIAHAGPRRGGVGAELAALLADHSILHLDAPIIRVTGEADLLAGHEEHLASPTAAAIAAAITKVVHY